MLKRLDRKDSSREPLLRNNKERALAFGGIVVAPSIRLTGQGLSRLQMISPNNTEESVRNAINAIDPRIGYLPEGMPMLASTAPGPDGYSHKRVTGKPSRLTNSVLMHELGHAATIDPMYATGEAKTGLGKAVKKLQMEHAANMWAMSKQKGLTNKLRQAAFTLSNTMDYGGGVLQRRELYIPAVMASLAYMGKRYNDRRESGE